MYRPCPIFFSCAPYALRLHSLSSARDTRRAMTLCGMRGERRESFVDALVVGASPFAAALPQHTPTDVVVGLLLERLLEPCACVGAARASCVRDTSSLRHRAVVWRSRIDASTDVASSPASRRAAHARKYSMSRDVCSYVTLLWLEKRSSTWHSRPRTRENECDDDTYACRDARGDEFRDDAIHRVMRENEERYLSDGSRPRRADGPRAANVLPLSSPRSVSPRGGQDKLSHCDKLWVLLPESPQKISPPTHPHTYKPPDLTKASSP